MNILKYTSIAFLMSLGLVALKAEEPKAYVAETSASSETFRSRVLKVHHFIEANFEYLAYTIDWRGHEVVVVASSAEEILKVGDEIRCSMRSSSVKVDSDAKAVLTFSIISSRVPPSENARLQAVAAEVNRRRAERAAEGTKATEKTEK